jgi:hypothetical protein
MRAKRASMGRGTRLRGGGSPVAVAVAVAAVCVALVGSAQAASTKPYTATVHQTLNEPGSFTLTVTNDPKAQQALGSANFTPPAGFTVSSVSNVTNGGFHVSVSGNVVQFRANSNQTALGKGGTVSADVVTSVPQTCTSATWGVEAKQSNDFSGTPGNDLSLGATGTDLTPLGSFIVAPIETDISSVTPPLHVPQIVTNVTEPVSVTAKDTCGNTKSDYSGAALAEVHSPPRLAGAGLPSSLSWSGGVGSASFKPVNVEVVDQLSVSDPVTGISATSNSFDVVETICAVAGTTCTWQNKNNTINATSTVPGNGQALGLGFQQLGSVTCTPEGGTPLSPKGEAIEIDPVNYTGPYTITLVYAKSVSGTGSTPFVTCLSKDNGASWFAVPDCGSTVPVNTAPCVQSRKRVTGGALQIVLFLEQGDPGSAGFG